MKKIFQKKPILFLDILTHEHQLKKRVEQTIYKTSYAEYVRRMCGIAKSDFLVVDASRKKFPPLTKFAGLIIGGSFIDPVRPKEQVWVEKTFMFVQKVADAKIQILGICGGLQFTVRALNGKIIYNPRGRNFGTNEITLTKEGVRSPLFQGLHKKIVMPSSHRCIVKKLRPGWKLLAHSRKTPIEALTIGNTVFLVQFHPEMSPRIVQGIARMRKAALTEEGFFRHISFSQFLKNIHDTRAHGKIILRNFLREVQHTKQSLSEQ